MIASTTFKVLNGILKLELETHLLPKSRAERQITSTLILTDPNMVVTEDKGTLANSTSSNLTFIAMNDQLFHLRTSVQAAIEIFAIPSMNQVFIIPFKKFMMFHR